MGILHSIYLRYTFYHHFSSVVGELLPIVSFTEKGLVPAGSLMCSDISGDFSPKYIILELIDSGGTNLIIDLPKPASNSLLFVNALNNGSSTDIQSCNVKVLGNAISNIESIRYIKENDSKYYIEIKLNNGYYMGKIGIYALAKSIKGAMASKTPFDINKSIISWWFIKTVFIKISNNSFLL